MHMCSKTPVLYIHVEQNEMNPPATKSREKKYIPNTNASRIWQHFYYRQVYGESICMHAVVVLNFAFARVVVVFVNK